MKAEIIECIASDDKLERESEKHDAEAIEIITIGGDELKVRCV